MMKQLHEIQLAILRKLLFAESLRYSELKPDTKMENNQLSFHLDVLVDLNYVEKNESGYSLTHEGKEYANRMDTDTNKIERQPKSWALVVAMRYNGEENEFLFYTRKKHPHFGKQGFITGKIKYGEGVYETAIRELEEEAWITGDATLIWIEHLINIKKWSTIVLEDKFFYVFIIKNIEWNLVGSEEWEYYWVPKSKISEIIKKPFSTIERTLDFIDKIESFDGNVSFREVSIEVEGF